MSDMLPCLTDGDGVFIGCCFGQPCFYVTHYMYCFSIHTLRTCYMFNGSYWFESVWTYFLSVNCSTADFSKSVARVPEARVCRLLSFSMFLLFHVCDCNTPLVTHFKVQIKQVIQLETVRFFGKKEAMAPMHAPELHGTALLQPCILPNAPECTFAEQSVNEHKMSVDTQCVLWSGQIVDLKIAHAVVLGTVVGGFSCFYLVIRIFWCLFCFVTLRKTYSSIKSEWCDRLAYGITTACESVSPFSITLSHISSNI